MRPFVRLADPRPAIEVHPPTSRRGIPPTLELLEPRILLHASGDWASGEYAHQWIAQEAASFLASQFATSELQAYLGTIPGSADDGPLEGVVNPALDVGDDVLEGTREEDKILRWMEHFVAGGDATELDQGLYDFQSAFQDAAGTWADAVSAYGTNVPLAYYYLGRVAHLVADMTVPAHVHNDPHVEHPDTYETRIAAGGTYEGYNVYFGNYSSSNARGGVRLYGSLEDLFRETANYTEDYDSNDCEGDWDNADTSQRFEDVPFVVEGR